ncbi:MAG: chromosome segregation ATPase, partial [Coleofasciculus sp. C3-bin4]|nr:chromosome segregation ATPase [Coleofasciculus sp. C3-bin4]
QEARDEIRRWTSQVETLEDQPYLDRANQIASFGGAASLQEAIQEASRIAPGRALYKQAQEKIAQWTDTIQRQQDQPYLDQARALANAGNLPEAIRAAQQIRRGRALYGEAQSEIRSWQAEIEGQQRLQEAYRTATAGTAEALSEAIRVARQVPSSSTVKGDARVAVNRWSNDLLAMAQDRSSYNIAGAIKIAKMIPSGTEAYEAAQERIQSWQNILYPPPPLAPAPVPQPSSTDTPL